MVERDGILLFGSSVVYYTKKRQDGANFLSTSEKNQGMAKEEKMKMSPFYVEGDRRRLGNLEAYTKV